MGKDFDYSRNWSNRKVGRGGTPLRAHRCIQPKGAYGRCWTAEDFRRGCSLGMATVGSSPSTSAYSAQALTTEAAYCKNSTILELSSLACCAQRDRESTPSRETTIHSPFPSPSRVHTRRAAVWPQRSCRPDATSGQPYPESRRPPCGPEATAPSPASTDRHLQVPGSPDLLDPPK